MNTQERLKTVARNTVQRATQTLHKPSLDEKVTSLYARLASYIALKEEVERQIVWHEKIIAHFLSDAEEYSDRANRIIGLLEQSGVNPDAIDMFIRHIPQVKVAGERTTQ